MLRANSTRALKEHLHYLSEEIKSLQEEEAAIIAELIRRVPSEEELPGSSSAASDSTCSSSHTRSRGNINDSSSNPPIYPTATTQQIRRLVQPTNRQRTIATANLAEAFSRTNLSFAGVRDIKSIRDINIGDRVYITNSITSPTDNDEKDRSATVDKVNIVSRRVSITTDSGVVTNRNVRFLKFLREA